MTAEAPQVRLDTFSLPLQTPLATARGMVFERSGVVIVLTDEAGSWGRGEVAPLPGWATCSLDDLEEPLKAFSEAPHSFATTVPELAAGIGAAKWSLRAAQLGVPLWAMVASAVQGTEPATGERPHVLVNALANGSTPGELAEAVVDAVGAGYVCVKAKLGMGDDLQRLDALNDVVPAAVKVRLDVNSALPVADSMRLAEAAALRLGERLEYVEDPVASLDDMGEWNAVGVAGAVDELVRSEADVRRVATENLARFVVVKPPMVGGIDPAVAMVRAATTAGVAVVFSSLYDGPVGLSAWCHLAAGAQPDVVHGLGTAALFGPGAADQLVPYRGVITL